MTHHEQLTARAPQGVHAGAGHAPATLATPVPVATSRRSRLRRRPIPAAPVLPDRPRLALFTDTFVPQMNGVARTLARLVAEVRLRGADVEVVTASDPHASADWTVHRLPSLSAWLYPELRMAAPDVVRAQRLLERWRPTIVHVATPFGVGLAGRAAARRLGLPLVTSYHTSFAAYASHYGLGALAGPAWAYLRWFHNGGRRTFCPTRAIETDLASRGFRGTERWGRGVDAALFQPARRSDAWRARVGADRGDVVVAYVGRLAREKGLDLALDAIRHARRWTGRRVILAIAGDGPYADACRQRAPEHTVFVGRLEGDTLASFYASADVFVFPSQTDTFGNVVLEAMASGLAVVGVESAPTSELLGLGEPGGACGVLAPADPVSVGASIARLAEDAWVREHLASAARTRALTYSWDAVFDVLFASYRDVAAEMAAEVAGR